MYIHVLYVFTSDLEGFSRKSKLYTAAMIVFIGLSVFPGARAGFVTGKTNSMDSFALGAFANTRNLNGNVTGWVAECQTCFVELFKGEGGGSSCPHFYS